ncbi:MAG: protein kinase [Acidimicrobiales bacterium]|nr:protein kinase [Acidimicrobiales bacterium]
MNESNESTPGAVNFPDLSGTVLNQRYRLHQIIGTGTSGTVYVAVDLNTSQRVAVKVLHPSLSNDKKFIERFYSETKRVSSLNHPNILKLQDWGVDGSPYLVTEYLGGGSLRSILATGYTLSPSQALLMGLEACKALSHAHERGVIHQDIKPANFLFGQDGKLRISDFGLASALDEVTHSEIFTEGFAGTVRYASPEQASKQPLNGSSDIYALAIVFVEAITGRIPFLSDTLTETLKTRIGKSVPVPETLGPLAPTIQKSGLADPASRPTAERMRQMLLEASPALPRPNPLPLVGPGEIGAAPLPGEATIVAPHLEQTLEKPQRMRTVGPKRRWPTIALAALLLAGAIIGGIFLWQNAQTEEMAVPSVAGRQLEETYERLIKLGWTVEERYERRDGTTEGQILGTDPPAGSFYEKEQTVAVIISLGPTRVAIPADIQGSTLEAATQLIEEAGLTLGEVFFTYSEEVPKGLVIGSLALSEDLPRGGPVDLEISEGPPPKIIPEGLVGQEVSEVQSVLAALGLNLEIVEEYSSAIEIGFVSSISPPEQSEIDFGSTVVIGISLGLMPRAVPDVVGLDRVTAEMRLQSAGFLVIAVDGPENGIVDEQTPAAGEMAIPNDTIELVIQ